MKKTIKILGLAFGFALLGVQFCVSKTMVVKAEEEIEETIIEEEQPAIVEEDKGISIEEILNLPLVVIGGSTITIGVALYLASLVIGKVVVLIQEKNKGKLLDIDNERKNYVSKDDYLKLKEKCDRLANALNILLPTIKNVNVKELVSKSLNEATMSEIEKVVEKVEEVVERKVF